MAGYGGYGSTLGKTKIDDGNQQYYQPSPKKPKVEYDQGVWQQPEGFEDYSSYYGMYGMSDGSQQQQSGGGGSGGMGQQQMNSGYSQSDFDPNNYDFGGYTSSFFKGENQSSSNMGSSYSGNYYDNQQQSMNYQQSSAFSTNMTRPSGGPGNGRGNLGRGMGNRGFGNMRGGNRGGNDGSNFRGPNRGGFNGNNGRFPGMSRGFMRGGVMGSMRGGPRGGMGRGGPRGGRGGNSSGPQGDDNGQKWQTLPGGQTRPFENKEPNQSRKAKAEAADGSKLPLPDKLKRLCLFLRNEKRDINEIMLFENSLMSCKIGIRPDFMIDDTVQGKNGSFFTGRLMLEGIFLARGIGSNKKDIKLSCFKKALDICRTKTVEEIMELKDNDPEVIKEKLENLNSTSAKVEKETMAELPTEEILRKIQEIFNNPKYAPNNAISKLELAASVAKCRVRCRYETETCKVPSGKSYYKGRYFIDNVLQGIGASLSKKSAKTICYQMVVDRLSTTEVENLVDGLPDTVEETAMEDLNKILVKMAPKPKALELRDKFKKLKEVIQESDLQPDAITAMDAIFSDIKLTPVCLYRRSMNTDLESEKIFCNLYLASRLIIIGEADNRKDAQLDAYIKARSVLIDSDPEFILTQHSKLLPQDQGAPDVIDFRVKGNCILKDSCTNLHRLMRTKQKVSTLPVKDMVIFEHITWKVERKVYGFCILQHSCYINNMLLEWEFFDNDDKVFSCEMKIQKELVGTRQATSVSKIGSRNLAAADILFKLYETHPVVEVSAYTKLDQVVNAVSFDTLLKEAEVLKTAAEASGETAAIKTEPQDNAETKVGEDLDKNTENGSAMKTEEPEAVKTEDVKMESQDSGDTEMKEVSKTVRTKKSPRKPQYRHADRFILQAVQDRLDKYVQEKTLEDLVFGPAYPHHITRQINGLLKSLSVPVRFMIRSIKNQVYTIVTHSMTPKEIVEFLGTKGGQSGRFRLVDRSELPTHTDIEPELESGEIKPKKDKSGTGNFFEDVSIERAEDFHTALSMSDNSAYASTFDVTMTDTPEATPTKGGANMSGSTPTTPQQGNTSTPKTKSGRRSRKQ